MWLKSMLFVIVLCVVALVIQNFVKDVMNSQQQPDTSSWTSYPIYEKKGRKVIGTCIQEWEVGVKDITTTCSYFYF